MSMKYLSSQFPFTAAAFGDTDTWKSQLYVLLNRSSYALKSMIQQESSVSVSPIPRHLHLICILRFQIILFVFKPWCPRGGCSSFSLPSLFLMCGKAAESKLDLHPQDLGQENCSNWRKFSRRSLWVLYIPFTLFNPHKLNTADLRIRVEFIFKALISKCCLYLL